VKVLHELGHALACRHFGARPAEMGVLLLAGAPALYCDVSDAWRLPSKWRRMAVSSAGMFVELFIAAVCAIVWWHAAPGLLSALCLSLIIVCSVGTIAVNLNPLLRYDGYYLLADWLETPNLAERARGLVSGAWRQWLLGQPSAADPLVGPGKRRALWMYAILSKLYLALVLVGIFSLLVKLAKPRGLENAVYTVAAITLLGLLLGPILAVARMAANPSVRARLRWLRLAGTFAVLGGIAAAILAWPVTRRVTAPLVAVPAESHALFAVAPGELQFAAAEGAWVERGDIVARLANPEVELALAAAEDAVRERRAHLAQLRTLQATLPGAARMLPAAAAELADAEAHLGEQQTIADSLVIRAPEAGRVLAPPPRDAERAHDDTLPTWTGSPLEERNRGAWIEQGTPLAVIAPPGPWTAWAGVDQADAPDVQPGQQAHIIVDQHPTTIFTGRVIEVSRRARVNAAAGAAAAPSDAETLGDDRYHVVKLTLDAPDDALLASARGVTKIAAYDATVGELLWRKLRQTFTRML
jgi:putative peptide zinc metalloprotease protein